jgi:cytochrome c553
MRNTKIGVFSFYVLVTGIILALSALEFLGLPARTQAQTTPITPCPPWPLPLPSKIGPEAYQKTLNQYVTNNCYQTDTRWKRDADYRDTGFFFFGKSYGTHNAVRVYYSPEIYAWMQKGEPEDKIPDGAMIIKEMYPAPALQTYTNANRTGLAIMVRDSKVAWDGWYWADGGPTISYQYNYPNAGYALYCMNCHASTAKTDLTFAAMRNITGDPLVFNPTMPPNQITVTQSPLQRGRAGNTQTEGRQGIRATPQATPQSEPGVHEKRDSRPSPAEPEPNKLPRRKSVANFTLEASSAAVSKIPKQMVMEYYDTVTQGPRPKVRDSFLTSNQCIGCHDATQNNASQPNMYYPQIYTTLPKKETTEIDLNLSPYGEWRASMMGLSGRDPIFFAQLETELALHPEQTDNIVGTCLSCHGVMGQRQIVQDGKGPFKLEYLDQTIGWPESSTPFAKYGALARDGVSCTVCHRISDEGLGTEATYTGKFKVGKPDEIFGPYEDVVTLPMENALGLKPRQTKENQIRSSALCGSCHTVVLPILKVGQKYGGNPFDDPKVPTEHEQNTYLEWLNSIYQNEKPPINPATVQTCQDCHMPNRYPSKTGNQLQFKIASIEEDIFPIVDNIADEKDIHLKVRGADPQQPYSRHTLLGMNIFALEMFNQFSDTLGLVSYDPMAGFWGNPPNGLVLAKKSALDLARNETATVEILSVSKSAETLTAKVKVTNLAGHKFPSGVSFRRAFVEFAVNVGTGAPRWVSGATDDKGMIGYRVGTQFVPLVTESFNLKKNPQQKYQPHYETINDEKQVQIYEELIKDTNCNFTTSFLSLAHPVKDNRLMPKGWKCIDRPDGKKANTLTETCPDAAPPGEEPCGGTAPHGVPDDPRTHPNSAGYFDGSGSDIVTYEVPLKALRLRPGQEIRVSATIYYQTIPPYYLEQRRDNAPTGIYTQSLMYYVNKLDVNYIDPKWSLLLNEAPIKDWKLMIASTSKTLK